MNRIHNLLGHTKQMNTVSDQRVNIVEHEMVEIKNVKKTELKKNQFELIISNLPNS